MDLVPRRCWGPARALWLGSLPSWRDSRTAAVTCFHIRRMRCRNQALQSVPLERVRDENSARHGWRSPLDRCSRCRARGRGALHHHHLVASGPAAVGRLASCVWNGGQAHAAAGGGSPGEADRKASTRPDRRREQPDQEVEARQDGSQSGAQGPQADEEVAKASTYAQTIGETIVELIV